MSFLSQSLSPTLRGQLLRPAALNQVRFATQGYSNSPAPPKASKGSGGATRGTSDGHSIGEAKQGSSKRSFSTVASTRTFSGTARTMREDRPKTAKGLSPKILDHGPPKEEEQSDDVKKHNEDMSKRADRAFEGREDKEAFKKGNAPKDEATEKEKTG